jgi:hypothetical protein
MQKNPNFVELSLDYIYFPIRKFLIDCQHKRSLVATSCFRELFQYSTQFLYTEYFDR